MKLLEVATKVLFPRMHERLSVEDLNALMSFYFLVIEKLNLNAASFDSGTVGESWSVKHGKTKCQVTFESEFRNPPSLAIVKLLPKLFETLVKRELPGWELLSVKLYHKGQRVGHYEVKDYLEHIAPTLVGGTLLPTTAVNVSLKAPEIYQGKRRSPIV